MSNELTPQQSEILSYLGEGKSPKEIAFTMGLSPKTITHHTTKLYEITGARGPRELTKYANQNGYVRSDKHDPISVDQVVLESSRDFAVLLKKMANDIANGKNIDSRRVSDICQLTNTLISLTRLEIEVHRAGVRTPLLSRATGVKARE